MLVWQTSQATPPPVQLFCKIAKMTKQQAGNALQALLDEKMRVFAEAFVDGSRRLFVDDKGVLVHPGEFGSYREAITHDFLRAFIPQRMAVDPGFVVTSSGRISTQCDVVIYDRSVTPLLQNDYKQRFFPLESVCAVGEVKSVMSLADLKAALRKLSGVKSLRDTLYEPRYVHCVKKDGLASEYEPHRDERDQIITFLICEGFAFDIADKMEEVLSCYIQEHPQYPSNLRHNFVLSIRDGLLTYVHHSGPLFPFPTKSTEVVHYDNTSEPQRVTVEGRRMKNRLVMPHPGSLEHLRHFSTMMHQALTIISVLFPDMGRYIQAQDDVWYKDVDAVA
ncbi:Uncharacterised protein [Burkholderia pseudomallei]|uniref:DUF6602 domain-containing protein n=1 Tax=Burkholderia pseudomallei TaxID=28450 RepID=UPI00126A34D4|nr:DUF6602 domain-containing protein [Burkholderia pseudomallei]CAJ8144608.1 Uncharacterised protein [Burkholderia pseudomallei]CAJ8193724.1 Uncharacterised protein [Burkholderia pseudomallei]CAJ8933579.1 Uncharacterised protein [Burkholderia pseudomallei]